MAAVLASPYMGHPMNGALLCSTVPSGRGGRLHAFATTAPPKKEANSLEQ